MIEELFKIKVYFNCNKKNYILNLGILKNIIKIYFKFNN